MAHLQRKKNVYYIVDKSEGAARWIRLGEIAYDKARRAISRYEIDQTYLKLDLDVESTITFSEAAQEYLDHAAGHKAATTMRCEARDLGVIGRQFGRYPLAKLRAQDYEEFLARKAYRPNALRLKIAVLRALYKFAVGRGYLKKNAATELRRPRLEVLPPRYVDRQTIETLFGHMGPAVLPKFKILYFTGMRPSEVLRLRAGDVHIKDGMIVVERSKTGRFRTIPIHPEIAPHLKALMKGRRKGDYLFPSHDGGHQTELRDGLRLACVRAGIDPAITPYQFRHSFATEVLNKTRDIRAVQQLLGHSTIQQTTRYATALDERLVDAVARL